MIDQRTDQTIGWSVKHLLPQGTSESLTNVWRQSVLEKTPESTVWPLTNAMKTVQLHQVVPEPELV